MKLLIYSFEPGHDVMFINTCDGNFDEVRLLENDPRLPRLIFDYVIDVVKYKNPVYEVIIMKDAKLWEKYTRWRFLYEQYGDDAVKKMRNVK